MNIGFATFIELDACKWL